MNEQVNEAMQALGRSCLRCCRFCNVTDAFTARRISPCYAQKVNTRCQEKYTTVKIVKNRLCSE